MTAPPRGAWSPSLSREAEYVGNAEIRVRQLSETDVASHGDGARERAAACTRARKSHPSGNGPPVYAKALKTDVTVTMVIGIAGRAACRQILSSFAMLLATD